MFRLKAVVILLIVLFAFSVSAQEAQTIHIVLPGENLFRIAQDYGVDVDTIARANDITNTWRIDIGQRLIIPTAADTTSLDDTTTSIDVPSLDAPTEAAPIVPLAPMPTAAPTAAPTQYVTVGRGQSLAQIALQYGMTVNAIARMNDITNPDLIYAGQRLLVAGSDTSADTSAPAPTLAATSAPLPNSYPDSNNVVTHIVQPGETLATIGLRYGISWLLIAQANNIYDANHVEVGQELTIPGGTVISDADYSFITAPAAPPAIVGTGKEIIVDLSDSRTYAYEDGKLVRNVLSSTGLPDTPTVRGDFKIQRKYVAQTMTGPGYYLPDVPYVMYFYAGYALHGTYWHNNFGHPMSHGCVNLPTPEAAWFYDWTEIGTPVHVQA